MKPTYHILFLLVAAALFAACNKQIAEKQANPNNPSSVQPNLILGTVLTDLSGTGAYGRLGGTGSSEGINSWDGAHRWNQYHCSNYDYYDNNIYSWTNGSFDSYLVLTDVDRMQEEITSRGGNALNPFEAIGRFIKAYYYYNLSSLFGDVPLSDALQGLENFKPSYTSQEKVFAYVLDELDSANNDLTQLISNQDNTLSKTQDIYYGGNLTAWQKLVNSFKLRVLIALSKRADDATLNVAAQFSVILSNPSKYLVFESQDDDLKFIYNPGETNTYSIYPFNPTNFGSIAQRLNMADTYVGTLTSLSDARVFTTSEPAWALAGNDPNPAQYKYFKGASTGEPLATMYGNATAGLYSFINRYRYYSNYTGEPDVLVGYKEMCFNIAEAIERGWIGGNAEDWYKKGITESMAFYGIDINQTSHAAYFLPPTANSVTQVQSYPFNFDFAAYYAQPAVKLSADAATAIGQIVLQKYIATFQNSGYEAYYNWRRTGVPGFQGGSGVGNNGDIPKRWAYPVAEQVVNTENWKAAVTAQQFSADDLNQVMWLIK
ncbi:MAG TPA: SusD/RagB family nutrient-binding outer membrane lipoprotein [Puia sp.]|nr:SusD/RagB family nutrient-binding outer membrane lipoprotein [Puia sp.]